MKVRNGSRADLKSLPVSRLLPRPPRLSQPVFRQGVRHDGVGVAVAHVVLVLEQGHQFHVLGRIKGADLGLPLADGPSVLLLDGGEIGRRALDRRFSQRRLPPVWPTLSAA